MAKWTNTKLFDFGLDYPRSRVAGGATVRLAVIKAYAAGDSYATVTANIVGYVDLAAGDFTLAAHATTGRKLTTASQPVTFSANSGASPDNHFALLDVTGSEVLAVTDETGDQQIYSGNTSTIPAIEFLRFTQPT
jgi:hypothetical protein